jgi:hypothetical protein
MIDPEKFKNMIQRGGYGSNADYEKVGPVLGIIAVLAIIAAIIYLCLT